MTNALRRSIASLVVAAALVVAAPGHHAAPAPRSRAPQAPSSLSCRDNGELKLPASVADVEACVTGL